MSREDFDLDAFLPYRLNRAAEWASLRFATLYKARHGMTRPEWRTLANLGQYGRLSAKQICELSTQHKTKVSRAVAALEARKWLRREPNTDDRREEWLELTSQGRRIYVELSELGLGCDRELETLLGAKGAKSLRDGLAAIEELMTPKK